MMINQTLPRIAEVAPGEAPLTLRLRWRSGGESLVDVSGLVRAYRVYSPLREDPELFRRVRVGEHGTDAVWTEDIDMSADTLWRLAQDSPQVGINALLPCLAADIEAIKEREEKRAKETAYRFDPFSYLRTNELGVCRIIKDLLRPKGEHGQGALFLKQFLAMLCLSPTGAERARVVTEALTTETDQNRRRIDIYIELDDGRIVAIEAKPFARENDDQLKNMIEHAEKRSSYLAGGLTGAVYAVFITPDGREPITITDDRISQLKAEGRLILRRFNGEQQGESGAGSIRTWIDACAAAVSVDRLKWFLREFSQHLCRRFPTNTVGQGESAMGIQDDVADAVLGKPHPERLAAFYIADALDVLRKEAWLRFIRSLSDRLSKLDQTFEIVGLESMLQDPLSARRDFSSFIWRRPEWPLGNGIALQIEFTPNVKQDTLVFGFVAPSTRVPKGKLNGWGVHVLDSCRKAIWHAAEPRFATAFSIVGNVECDPEWWPILVNPLEPLDKPFTPEGLAAISDPITVDNFVECFRVLHEATRDLAIEAA